MKVRIAALVAATAAVLVFAGPATATGDPSKHIVEVTKVVEGDVPDDAHFVIDVCGQPVSFDEEGGTQTVEIGDWFDGDQSCAVTETDDGGASDVEGETTCEFTGKDYTKVETTDETREYEDQVCPVTIVNEFDEPTTTTTAPEVIVTPPTETVVIVPTPVVASPRLTG